MRFPPGHSGNDAVPAATLEGEIPNIFDANTEEAVRSIQRIKLIRASADATVWISHDPEDWAELKHAPACYE